MPAASFRPTLSSSSQGLMLLRPGRDWSAALQSKCCLGWWAAETPPRFHGEAEGHRIGLVVLCPLAALVGLVVGGTVMVVPPAPVNVVLTEMVAALPW